MVLLAVIKDSLLLAIAIVKLLGHALLLGELMVARLRLQLELRVVHHVLPRREGRLQGAYLGLLGDAVEHLHAFEALTLNRVRAYQGYLLVELVKGRN